MHLFIFLILALLGKVGKNNQINQQDELNYKSFYQFKR